MNNDKTWKMPPIAIGHTVNWYPRHAKEKPQCALVTDVGTNGINLAVLADGARQFRPESGVPHVDDPTRLKRELNCGCWDYVTRLDTSQPTKVEMDRTQAGAKVEMGVKGK